MKKKTPPNISLENRNAIARNLVYIRRQKGFTQSLVATRAGISLRTLISAEVNGQPTQRTLKILSEFYKIPISVIKSENFIESSAQYYEFKDEALSYYMSVSPVIETNHYIISDYITNYLYPMHRMTEQYLKQMGCYISYIYEGLYNYEQSKESSALTELDNLQMQHLKYYPMQENESPEVYKKRLDRYVKEGLALLEQKKGFSAKNKKFNKEFVPIIDARQKEQKSYINKQMSERILVDRFNELLDEKIKNAKRKYKSHYEEQKFFLSAADAESLQMSIHIYSSFDLKKAMESGNPLHYEKDQLIGQYSISEYKNVLEQITDTIKNLICNISTPKN